MKKTIDEYFPIALLYGLSAYFLTDIEEFTPDSLLYPKGLVWVLLGLTTLLLVCTLLKKIKLPKIDEDRVPHKFTLIFSLSLVYVFAVPYLGFVLSSLFYCPVTAVALGYKRKGMALGISAAVVVLIYVGFKMLLKVPLPTITLFGATL